jgi:hypothetical protein
VRDEAALGLELYMRNPTEKSDRVRVTTATMSSFPPSSVAETKARGAAVYGTLPLMSASFGGCQGRSWYRALVVGQRGAMLGLASAGLFERLRGSAGGKEHGRTKMNRAGAVAAVSA